MSLGSASKQKDENKFLFEAKNFEISNIEILHKAKDLFEPLMQYDANSIIDKDKFIELKDEYDFQIVENGVKISAPNLLKLVFKALKNDSDATNDIIAIVSPLLRKLPGGIALYKIMSNLSKNNLEKTMSVMPTLVRIMLLTKFDFNPNITEAEIKERIEQLKFTEPLINGVVAWINSLILLINKSTTQIDMSLFQNVFLKMMSCLEKYESGGKANVKIVHNPIWQAKFMLMILGLWRKNFEMIHTFASEMGCFDAKVKELFSIFVKYKDIIFRNGAIGLPPIKKKLINSQLKQGIANQVKNTLFKSLSKEGTNMMTDLARSGGVKLSKAAKAQMEKVSKFANTEKITETGMIFADMFRRFDAKNL